MVQEDVVTTVLTGLGHGYAFIRRRNGYFSMLVYILFKNKHPVSAPQELCQVFQNICLLYLPIYFHMYPFIMLHNFSSTLDYMLRSPCLHFIIYG